MEFGITELLIGLLVGLAVALAVYFILNASRQKQQLLLKGVETERDHALARQTELQQIAETERKKYTEQESLIRELTSDLSRMAADYENLTSRMKEREQEVNGLQQRFTNDFRVLAHNIMKNQSEQLSAYNKEQLGQMLTPLKERLQEFEKKVNETYQKEARERFHLQKEIQQLVSLNHQMSEDAQNLTRALKGDNKAQGTWGEMVLARVLESSGLRKGEEFNVQQSLKNERGDRLQPDVVVKLPEDRHIIIDSKVSLKAYEGYISAEEESQRLSALKLHLESVRQHIRSLSDKHYHQLGGLNSPDFVLMFMPIEAAFGLAIEQRQELFTEAWDKHIVVVSPTTLLATLRTVASIWKLERQNAYAQEIARQGGQLYDKFVGFVSEMDKIGQHLDRASRSHQDAMKKLRDGRGALTSQAEKLRELGVKNKKQLE